MSDTHSYKCENAGGHTRAQACWDHIESEVSVLVELNTFMEAKSHLYFVHGSFFFVTVTRYVPASPTYLPAGDTNKESGCSWVIVMHGRVDFSLSYSDPSSLPSFS